MFHLRMRQGRIKAPPEHPIAFYHCISRVVDRRKIFDALASDSFTDLMRRCTDFCGVQVITHAVMANHFHILVAVPRRPQQLPTDGELCVRIQRLNGDKAAAHCRQQLELLRQDPNPAAAEAYRQQFFRRMWDVSAFMKELKQRFTGWVNRQTRREGTLWQGRFRSVLADGLGEALASMAAYIDLNPVRANATTDPANYRWCGYAEAMAGQRPALEGLRVVVAALRGVAPQEVEEQEILPAYRVWLFSQGEENEGTDETGRALRKGIPREEVLKVVANRGQLSRNEYLRIHVRYFTAGGVVGGRNFVNEVFEHYRSRFGPRRKDGARRMKGLASPKLYALRDLRINRFS